MLWGIEISRQADFAPVGSVGYARRLGFAGEANGVAADQKMCAGRRSLASQMKDNLGYLDRVADLTNRIKTSAPRQLTPTDETSSRSG